MNYKLMITLFLTLILSIGTLSAQTENRFDDTQTLSDIDRTPEANAGAVFTHAARRLDKPFQIQLVQTFGPATPLSFAPGGGLHLGYQLSRTFYMGLTSSAFADGRNVLDDYHNNNYDTNDDRKYDDGDIYGQGGSDITKSKLDPMHLLELRVTPWDFGLYLSFGMMYRGKQSSTTDFKSEERTVGNNKYTTGLTATVDYKEWYGASTGLGFNYIFQSGLTLGTAMSFGLNAQTPDVTVSSTAAVSVDDLAYWKKQIQTNERQLPYLYTLSLGYAF